MADTKMTVDEALAIANATDASHDWIKQAIEVLGSDPQYKAQVDALNAKLNGVVAGDEEKTNSNADEDIVFANYERLYNISNTYKYDDFIKSDPDLSDIVANVQLVDKGTELKEKDQKDNLDLMFRAAKLKAEMALAEDKDFAKADDEKSQKDRFDTEVKKIFFADLAMAACSSSMDKPTSEEKIIGSKAYNAYIEKQSEKAQKIFKDLIEAKKKVSVEVDRIITNVADASVVVENTLKRWQTKAETLLKDGKTKASQALSHTISALKPRKNQLEEKAKMLWGERYAIMKSVRGSLHDNALKIGTNLAASVAFGGALMLGSQLAPAVAAYGAYHAVTGWAWPMVAEYRKINRERKEQGLAKKSFKETWAEAKKNIFSDKRQKRKYYIMGATNTALGIAGITWAATSLTACDTAVAAADAAQTAQSAIQSLETVAATKATVRLARAAGASGAQLVDAGVSGLLAKTEEEKKVAKREAKFAVLGATFSYLLSSFGHTANAAENAAKHAENLTEAVKGFEGASAVADQPDVPETGVSAEVAPETEGSGAVDVAPEAEQAAEVASFPREYSSDMGISRNEYNTLVRTTEGSLTREGVTLDSAYGNLTDEVMKKNFPGMTREQVMYSFNRLYSFMRKAYDAGDGTLRETPSGDEFLEHKFGALHIEMSAEKKAELLTFAKDNTYADKATLSKGLKEIFGDDLSKKDMGKMITIIHSNTRFNQNAEGMEALMGLLGCGKALNDEQGKAVSDLLARKDEILGSGTGSNYMTGLNLDKGCADDDGQWVRGAVKAPVVEEPAASVVEETPVERDDLPAVAQTHETFADKAAEAKPMEAPKKIEMPAPEGFNEVSMITAQTIKAYDQHEGADAVTVFNEAKSNQMINKYGTGNGR